MSDRLSLSQVAALTAYAAAMAGGQLLFKTAAPGGAGDGPLAAGISGFLLNGHFFVALILHAAHAALTHLWVRILSFIPLSRAYPFLALAFAERSSMRLVIGIVPILCVLFFIAG
jgi:hypothetical protein